MVDDSSHSSLLFEQSNHIGRLSGHIFYQLMTRRSPEQQCSDADVLSFQNVNTSQQYTCNIYTHQDNVMYLDITSQPTS
jgi:hypothetical protein